MMYQRLTGLALGLVLLGGASATESPNHRHLTGADAQQAAQWQQQIDAHLLQDQLDDALPLARKLHELRAQRLGADHWESWDTRFQVEDIQRSRSRPPAERQQLQQARQLNVTAYGRHQAGQYAETEKLFRQVLALQRKALPADHLDLAQGLNNLATTLHAQGKSTEAVTLYRQALAIEDRVLPAGHPRRATTLNNLGFTLNVQGKATAAEPLHRQALRIAAQGLPIGHPDRAHTLNNLARNLENQGKAAEAEPLLRQALALREQSLPPGHPSLILSLNALAANLFRQGKAVEAEPLSRRAVALATQALPANHPQRAQSLNHLAAALHAQGKLTEAETLFRQSLALQEQVLPVGHPDRAQTLQNLAGNLRSQHKYAEAEQLDRQALAASEQALPASHPYRVHCLNNLALTLQAQGKIVAAEQFFRQALALREQSLPAGHPDRAESLTNLANLLQTQGKDAEAVTLLQRASQSFAVARLQAAVSGADRARFTLTRFPPDLMLATLLAKQGRPVDAWQAGEARLARGLLDDLTRKELTKPSSTQLERGRQLHRELEELSRRILQAQRQPQLDQPQQRKLQDWVAQSQKVSEQLASLAAAHSQEQLATLTEVQQRLPADTALVYWVDWQTVGRVQGDHWACVVRAQGPPVWIRLPGSGDRQAWTRADDDLFARLRQALGRPTSFAWQALARELDRQRLQPLEPHLKGVGRLLVVPSDRMAGIPLEAVTERWTISYVPSATIHARLRNQPRPLQASLLAVGDPVFRTTPPPVPPDHGLFVQQVLPGGNAAQGGLRTGDVLLRYQGVRLQRFEDLRLATEGKALVPVQLWRSGAVQDRAVRPGPLDAALAREPAAEAIRKQRAADAWLAQRGGDYAPLPGTRWEVEAIGQLFTRKRLLLGSQASEQRLDALIAADELKQYRILHLATHGQMHPTDDKQCALILARDQLPDAAEQLAAGKKVYDGQLKVEALAHWPLDADLVVLSACETGLGPEGGGEGFLGFSQGLLRQGVRSVVLSLWKVDDTATALLMQRFYQNLLGKRPGLKTPLGRAAALTEAKTWLRQITRAEAEQLAVQLSGGSWRGKVEKLQLAPEDPKQPPPPPKAGDRPFAHPAYWAAFILLGDPD